MKKKSVFILLILGCALTAGAQESAAAIVRSSRERIKADTISTRSRMTITAKNGGVTERLIDQYSKDGPRGGRTVIVFQQPAGVRGTRFLTMENAGGADDRWIFLPGVGRVRRLAASEGSDSFMGTDLSYDDISSADRSADLDSHVLLREESLQGKPCFVIESKPKDSAFQYSRMVSWIDRETRVSAKMELYDRRNALVKVLEVLEVRNVQGRLSPWVSRMSTLAAGTSTTITVEILKYDDPIPEGVFTTAYLETGRPQ